MGTLDDAIREHLELKRRAGATDDEVRQLESEAFGPPEQRRPAPPEEPEEAVAAAPPEEPADPELPPPAAEPVPEPEPWLPDEEPDAAADDVAPAAEGKPGEDLLEETPDFLQETPEHDRLWFEQKPPRDFDFDE